MNTISLYIVLSLCFLGVALAVWALVWAGAYQLGLNRHTNIGGYVGFCALVLFSITTYLAFGYQQETYILAYSALLPAFVQIGFRLCSGGESPLQPGLKLRDYYEWFASLFAFTSSYGAFSFRPYKYFASVPSLFAVSFALGGVVLFVGSKLNHTNSASRKRFFQMNALFSCVIFSIFVNSLVSLKREVLTVPVVKVWEEEQYARLGRNHQYFASLGDNVVGFNTEKILIAADVYRALSKTRETKIEISEGLLGLDYIVIDP